MSTVSSFLFTAGGVLGTVRELARYGFRFCWAMLLPKARLAARVLAAESQLAVALHTPSSRRRQRRHSTPAFRLLWVALSRFPEGWEELAHLMKPEMVKRWHTRAFRLLRRWRSRPGRPPIPDEMQEPIRRLSRKNPLWGPDRIRDVLLLPGQRHLERLLGEYLDHYYHTAHPHQSLGGEKPSLSTLAGEGKLVFVPVVGGLRHRHYRAAA